MSTESTEQKGNALFYLGVMLIIVVPIVGWYTYQQVLGNATFNTTITTNPDLERGLVGHWTFDGKDMVGGVLDRSGNGNNGTLKNFTSTTTVPGKTGQALSFSTATSGSPRQHVLASGPLSPPVTGTIAGWFTYSGSSAGILGRFTCGNVANRSGFHLRVTGGVLRGELIGTGGTNTVNSPSTITTNEWYFGALSFDGGLVSLYVDGSVVATTSQTVTDFGACNNSTQAFIGGNMHVGGGVYANLNGSLDDVRLYNRALSSEEVTRLYELGATTHINTSINTNPDLETGLVGHWTFDGDLNTAITDHSGNGNHGYIVGAATSSMTTLGKIGQALSFDGSDDRINLGLPDELDLSGEMTIAGWMKANGDYTTTQTILASGTGLNPTGKYQLLFGYTDNKLEFLQHNSVVIANLMTSGDSIADDDWHFFSAVRTGSSGSWTTTFYIDDNVSTDTSAQDPSTYTGGVFIGALSSAGALPFKGSLDDVRIYNRALSAEEVTRLYELGATTHINTSITTNPDLERGLVGHWTFDGKDMDWGSTTAEARDRSGQGNHGNVTNFDSSSAIVGKIGQALEFDGVDDQIGVTSFNLVSTTTTFVAWLKLQSCDSFDGILFSRGTNVSGLNANSSCNVGYHWNSNISTYNWNSGLSIPLNEWVFVAVSVDSSKGVAYLGRDGILQSSTNNVANTASVLDNLKIGRDNTSSRFIDGLIDDVRIYNRALSAEEVKRLYELGN